MSEKAASKTKATKTKAGTGFNFEDSLEQLETLVAAMEDGELSLEESLEAFEKGVKLTRECQTALRQAEQKVQVLLDESGTTQDLNLEDEPDESPF
ncbi:MAG: exodeoxyribonuclease VII small subunit [Pseudohongiellaceae bacterium]|jgi:exodeoxyribonuclease VII small subunit